jgi:Na+-translocating ferredoxin:NAD+ oxidoreductase RnfD subunit
MDIRARLKDPRYYQIAVLAMLAVYGIVALDFGVRPGNALAIVITALAVQFFGTRMAGLPRFDPLSPLITSLSLTLLLRTDLVIVAVIAAAIAIGSKFLIRVRGKHVFNPANVGIVTLILFTDHAWISSGQWGNAAIAAFALACLGCVVLTRAKRAETTIAFICTYALLLFGHAIWLGDPLTIPLHQVQNGALLLFAFFMISDPKTTPDTQPGRVLYGALVASVAYTIQFVFYEPHGPIIALILTAPVVPLIDFVLHGKIYRWDRPSTGPLQQIKGVN